MRVSNWTPELCCDWYSGLTRVYRRHRRLWRREEKLSDAQQTHRPVSANMSHRQRALSRRSLALALLLWRVAELAVAAEYSSKTDLDYEFGDYRGKWCIDDHGFVYGIGEVYYPSPTACPCTCTVDGPVCVRPRCPRIHPRCTRIRYKACCPVCEAMARVCVYGGKTYRLLEEFRVRKLLPSLPRPLHKFTQLIWSYCAHISYNKEVYVHSCDAMRPITLLLCCCFFLHAVILLTGDKPQRGECP